MNRIPPPAREPGRRNRRLVIGGLVLGLAAITAAVGYEVPKSSSSSPAPPSPTAASSPSATSPSPSATPPSPSGPPSRAPRRAHRHRPGPADGVVPDGVTVLDTTVPAVTRLDPGLLEALRRAAKDAAADRVTIYVNSGWRSPAYQDQLLREAVAKYGSEERAAQWVATAATSPHVSGDAVDIGRAPAVAWLSHYGAAYGLCRIYRNEPWHYELRTEAIDHGCPHLYADPTQDPRMQR